MKTALIAIGVMLAMINPVSPFVSEEALEKADSRTYKIQLQGRQGLKMEMLLITKSGPRTIAREAKQVVLPFEHTFEANRFFVWFDTPAAHLDKSMTSISGPEFFVHLHGGGEDVSGKYYCNGKRRLPPGGAMNMQGKVRLGRPLTLSWGDL